MIAFLRGIVIEYGEEWLLLETAGGVGYKIFTTPQTIANVREKQSPAALHTYLSIKEDGWTLFGFIKREEKEFFELLLKVSGVGPKMALNILATLSLPQIQRAIQMEDLIVLTQVPGIGRKTAQRMVLELKEKIKNLVEEVIEPEEKSVGNHQEVLEVLMALGYSALEAREALAKVFKEDLGAGEKGTQELVPLALRYLARQ